MDSKYQALFTPWKIRDVEIKNRIVLCPMGGTSLFGWMEPNHFDKEAANFFLERAKNNVGLIIPGIAPIRDTIGGRWLYQNKKMFRELKAYMEKIHATGAKLFVQITAGRGRSWGISDEVLPLLTGTDDPAVIGEKVKDWDTFKASAEELKAKGYYALASYADTFRLYGNSISQPWGVEGSGTITVDPQIMQWVSDSKEWLDAGYLNKTVKGQFNDDWNKAMGSASKVFAFLLPAWGIDFTLAPNWDGPAGSWAVTNPPQEYNWGGSYIHACQGTDNPDFTNTMSGMQEAATDDSFASEFLGGQNAYEYFSPVAENIVIAPLSSYDQGCVELIQNAFSDYYQGNVDFDRAKENFETAIKERYPDITTVVWPD